MTHTVTVPARMRRCRPQSSTRARMAWRSQDAVRRQAVGQERHRLARELHDGAIQDVLVAGLTIGLCLAELPADSPLRAKLEEAKRLTGVAMRRLRSSLQTLREGADAAGEDLPDMLRRLRAGHPAHQLAVDVEVTGTPVPLAPAVRRSLFQAASECVFNAAVHARADHVTVRLSYRRGTVGLRVADDGRGKPETLMRIIRGEVPGTGGGYHTGLADIAARTAELGGTLRAGRSGLGGIVVRVVLPVSPLAGTCGDTDG